MNNEAVMNAFGNLKYLLTSLCLLVILSSTVSAQRNKGSLYLGASASFSAMGNNVNVSLLNGMYNATWSPQASLDAGYLVADNLAVTFSGRYGNLNANRLLNSNIRNTLLMGGLGVRYSLAKTIQLFSPYVGATLGTMQYEHHSNEWNERSWALYSQFAFGFEFSLTRALYLNTGFGITLAQSDKLDGFVNDKKQDGFTWFQTGLTLYIGGSEGFVPPVNVFTDFAPPELVEELNKPLAMSGADEEMKPQDGSTSGNFAGLAVDENGVPRVDVMSSVVRYYFPGSSSSDQRERGVVGSSSEPVESGSDGTAGMMERIEKGIEQIIALNTGRENKEIEIRLRPPSTTIVTESSQPGKLENALVVDRVLDSKEVDKRVVIVISSIFFELNSAQLSDAALQTLAWLVDELRRHPELLLELRGFACDTGVPAHNLSLSRNRSNAVLEYLLRHGIPSTRCNIHGYGANNPLLPNVDEEHRKVNRRVDISLVHTPVGITSRN